MTNPQISAQIIKDRAKEKNITLKKMLEDCGLSRNALSSMQSGGYMPRVENLCKLSDYLDCSVDYILCRTDSPKPETSYIQQDIKGDLSGSNSNSVNIGATPSGAIDEQQQEIRNVLLDLSPRERTKLMSMIYDFYDECMEGKK